MTSRVFTPGDWYKARARRAATGKAPRLSVKRYVVLRERPFGMWAVCILTQRYGIWRPAEWLCCDVPYGDALRQARSAWHTYGLPTVRHRLNRKAFEPFHFDVDVMAMSGGAA